MYIITTFCPHCSKEMDTTNLLCKSCDYCGKVFDVFPLKVKVGSEKAFKKKMGRLSKHTELQRVCRELLVGLGERPQAG